MDSLYNKLSIAKDDSSISVIYGKLCVLNYRSNPDTALIFIDKAIKLAKKIGNKSLVAQSINHKGVVLLNLGKYEESIKQYFIALEIAEDINDTSMIASNYNNIGINYWYQGDYKNALKYLMQALNFREIIGNKLLLSQTYTNIGILNLEISKYDEALKFYDKSLKLKEELGDKKGIAKIYNNIGVVYETLGKFKEAIKQYQKALDYFIEIGDKRSIVVLYNNMAVIYLNIKKYDESISYAKKSYKIAIELQDIEDQKYAVETLYSVYKGMDNYKQSNSYLEKFILLKDSLVNKENHKVIAELEAKYDTEKKKKEIYLLNAEKQLSKIELEKKQSDLDKQKIQKLAFALGFFFLIILSVVIYRGYRQKSVSNDLLTIQKKEIQEKNTEILSSIEYAKRIQNAILPPNKVVKEYLQESFIFYKPKDIVAGDFYWMEHKNGKVLFAAADCTGHGVPGAMVSVVCNNALNRSVREHGLTDPGKILNKSREIVIQEFEKSDEEVKDGMDIALCSLQFDVQNLKLKNAKTIAVLQYAGAHNPLWIITPSLDGRLDVSEKLLLKSSQGDRYLIEIKANKQPIGKFDNPLPYTTHTLELQHGDAIYIFSDGYVDQFGGEKGKKFKVKAFRNLLLSIQDKNMEVQKTIIDGSFETWKGDLEQIDDVCVIGVRI